MFVEMEVGYDGRGGGLAQHNAIPLMISHPI